MPKHDPASEAAGLYENHVVATKFTPPRTYADLLLFAELSGAVVCQVQSQVEDFWGIQISGSLFVSGTSQLTEHQRMRVLAHEWCHYLRRLEAKGRAIRLYSAETAAQSAENDKRDWEERVARAFARLF